jgi:hypothetical protein
LKLYSPCQQLLEESCCSCQAWSQLEQQRSGSLRSKLKLLAEVLLKMGQFKECLRMFRNSLLVMLRHKAEAVQADKIAEWGRVWISVTVSVMSLLGEGVGTLLRLSNTSMDRGMVLLEQAWVFLLGDNLEDSEMGARCAEKADMQLCGLAWYWRFMCEHRLLMLQVHGAMVRAGEERMVARR